MDYAQLLTSNAAVTFYVVVALYAYRFFKVRQQWETERWEGLVTSAFLAAEKSGFLNGNAKLQHALEIFNREYSETYGQPPSPMDVKDAALDLARKALELKFAPKGLL